MNNKEKLFAHLKTIRKHRRVVRKWCFKMGIPLQGLLHDLSKYSLSELSIFRYYTGTRSPHDTMRDKVGYSSSWFKHRNRNKHHPEYWTDSIERRTAVKMPYKYVIEMFCDFVGAGQAYNKNWKPSDPYDYYIKNCRKRIIYKKTDELIEYLLIQLSVLGEKDFINWYKNNKKFIKGEY